VCLVLFWANNIEKSWKWVDPLDVHRSACEESRRRKVLEILVCDEATVETRKYRILSRNGDHSYAK
jgi:hypothetical protein